MLARLSLTWALLLLSGWAQPSAVRSNEVTPFESGNIVVCTGSEIMEYSIDGDLIQTIEIPVVDSFDSARDIVVSDDGTLFVFNGVFEPSVSVLTPETGEWTHFEIDNWAIYNNSSYGGIAYSNGTVFVAGNLFSKRGIFALDVANGTVSHFATNTSPMDLSIGMDGFLYSLLLFGTEGRTVQIYNPANESFVKQITLSKTLGDNGHRSVTADRESNIYLASWYGDLHKIDWQGNILAEANISQSIYGNLYDINTDGMGNILVSNRSGECYITDMEFSNSHVISTQSSHGIFAAFVTKAKETKLHPGDYYGSELDDHFEIDFDRATVTLNGVEMPIPQKAARIRFFGRSGKDSVHVIGDSAVAESGVLELKGRRMTIAAGEGVRFQSFQSEVMEFSGTEPDSVVLIDSAGNDQLTASPQCTELSFKEDLLAKSSGPGKVFAHSFFGQDSAIYRGTINSEQIFINLNSKRVQTYSGMKQVGFAGFDSVFANTFLGGDDRVVVFGSNETDYVYSQGDFANVANSSLSYTIRGFERFDMYGSIDGFDRALFVSTPGSRFREGGNWKQLLGPNFRTSVFGFRRVDLIGPLK